jgi:hypothetical protein
MTNVEARMMNRKWQMPLYKLFLVVAVCATVLALFPRRIEAVVIGAAASALVVAGHKGNLYVTAEYGLTISVGLVIGIVVVRPWLTDQWADSDVISYDLRADFVATSLGASSGALFAFVTRRCCGSNRVV